MPIPVPNEAVIQANDRLLRVHEAAELLGVSTRLVLRLAARGELPRVHLGRAARFRLTDVEQLMREGAI